MSDLSPGAIQQIAEIVDRVVERRLGSSNTTNTNTNTRTTGSNRDAGAAIDLAVGNVLTSLDRMAFGIYDASNAISDVNKIVKGILPEFPGRDAFATAVEKIGNTGLAMNRSMMDSAKSGFTFSQNLGLYDEAVLSARMGLKDWNALIRESGTQLVGLSSDANKSGLTFLAVAKELQEDPGTRRAIIAGVGTMEEYNNALRIVSQSHKFQNLSNAQSTKDMADSAKGLVFELDMMAKLTGKSRDRMAKDIEEQNATAQMRLRIASMTAEEQAAMIKNQAIMSQLPKQAQELYVAYATGGLRTARDRENAAAFTGTNILDIIQKATNIKTTGPEADAERIGLTARINNELTAIGADRQRLQNMSVLAGTDNPFAQKMGGVFADLADLSAAATKREQEAKDRGENMDMYFENLYKAAAAKIANIGAQPKTPEEKGAAASQMLNAFEAKIKDLNVGAAVLFVDKLNTAGGELATNFEGMASATRPFTTEAFKNIGDNLKGWMESLGYTGEKITPQDRNNPMREDTIRRLNNGNVPPTPPASQTNPIPSNARGTKDTFGDWFAKDWGNGGLSKLHGVEAVVPQEKIGEFIKDMVAKTPTLLSDLQGNLKSTLSEARSAMPTTDTFKDMFSNIKFPEIPNTADGTGTTSSNPFASASQNSEVMTELARGINQLNMRVERLITAVEDGADKNVRATKTKGNVLA